MTWQEAYLSALRYFQRRTLLISSVISFFYMWDEYIKTDGFESYRGGWLGAIIVSAITLGLVWFLLESMVLWCQVYPLMYSTWRKRKKKD